MNFDDIRPYRDEEVQAKLKELSKLAPFMEIMQKMMPQLGKDQILAQLEGIHTIKDLQKNIIIPVLDDIINQTIEQIEYSGLEHLEKDQAYLFVSTHRDIVMDSALMNYVLAKEGFETAEIAIGDNLMTIPWVVDVVKLNKTFIVKRNVPKENRLETSYQLSAYINDTVVNRQQSVWIAQRSGRSKDGNDQTNPGLIKMFQLSGERSAFEDIKSLNICPVSISYEYNPCDVLFLPELKARLKEVEYQKEKGEDVMHMALGIQGFKGKVSVDFGRPLNQEIEQFSTIKNKNDFFAAISDWIDKEIYSSFVLKDSSLAAYQLLDLTPKMKNQLSEDQLGKFHGYIANKLSSTSGDIEENKQLLYSMYAAAAQNKFGR